MKIIGNQITLRSFHPSDFADVMQYLSDKDNNLFVTSEIPTESAVYKKLLRSIEANKRENPTALFFAIEEKQSKKVIGEINLKIDKGVNAAEIGYILNKTYQGRGYMHHGVLLLLNWLFKRIGLDYIWANAEVTNIRSVNVLKNTGFKYQKTTITYNTSLKRNIETEVYLITPEIFYKQNKLF